MIEPAAADRRTARTVAAAVAARVTMAIVGLTVLGVAVAPSAGAVAPRPTDYRSEVLDVVPAAPVSVRVIGGDTWLELVVAPGHEVVVEGYGGEPYLRVEADGTVQINRRSVAVSLNQDRDAAVGPAGSTGAHSAAASTDPADPATGAGPDWRPHGSGGRVVWHDHRIHVAGGTSLTEPVPWRVPLLVDGQAAVVEGRVAQLDPPSPLPPLVLALAVGAAIWLVGRRAPAITAGMAAAAASLVATGTGLVEWQSVPSSVPRNPGIVILPAAAAVAAVIGLAVGAASSRCAARRRRGLRLVALLGSVSLLAGWVAFRWPILTKAVLVSSLDPTVDRAALALVLGAVVAAAGLTVTWAGSPTAAGAASATPSSSA